MTTLLVVAVGVVIAFVVFGPRKDIPLTAPQTRSPFILAGRNDLYGDAFNEAVLHASRSAADRRAAATSTTAASTGR